MGKITKIEDQKNKKRFNIFIDNAFFCGLNKETTIIANLSVGQDIEENKLKQLIFESEIKSAFEKAITLLSSKPYFENEIKQKLFQKEYDRLVIDEVVKKLKDYKYIDDEELSKHYVKINSKYSEKILKMKLKAKGVSSKILDNIFCEGNGQDEKICFNLMQKYIAKKPILNSLEKNKLFSHFYQKGFDFDLIKHCFSKCHIDNIEDN